MNEYGSMHGRQFKDWHKRAEQADPGPVGDGLPGCPEEQPRPLEEIVESAWKLAGPHFQSMSAQQVRMVERLVREAHASGLLEGQFNFEEKP